MNINPSDYPLIVAIIGMIGMVAAQVVVYRGKGLDRQSAFETNLWTMNKDLVAQNDALRKERDDLQDRCDELEKELKELKTKLNGGPLPGWKDTGAK